VGKGLAVGWFGFTVDAELLGEPNEGLGLRFKKDRAGGFAERQNKKKRPPFRRLLQDVGGRASKQL